MTKVILNGCSGKMGKMVVESAKNFSDIEIVAGIDKFSYNNGTTFFNREFIRLIPRDILADLNNGRVLLFSFIKFKSSLEYPVEHKTKGFLVFSVNSRRFDKASALEKSKSTS